LTFITPKDIGPRFFGLKPLDDWSLNVLGDWRAGAWANYNPNGAAEFQNIPNVQLVDYFNVDIRLNKTFSFKNVNIMLFMQVSNVFNIKRLSGKGFYDGFDQQFYFTSLHLPESSAYDNIPGDDRIGDYRPNGVQFQPIEQTGNYAAETNIRPTAIYYNTPTKQYMRYANNSWSEVPAAEIQKILDDKAYIDMPNDESVNFLNPRQIFFGVNLSFNL
jgi:hypothetical protein